MSKNEEGRLMIDLINLQNKIQKRLSSELSPHGVGLSEYLVLHQLYIAKQQKLRRSDLADLVGLSPSGVTRLLNPMEKIGLVVKEGNPRDARVSLVALSTAGKQMVEDAKISFEHASKGLLETLNENQLNEFTALLKTIMR